MNISYHLGIPTKFYNDTQDHTCPHNNIIIIFDKNSKIDFLLQQFQFHIMNKSLDISSYGKKRNTYKFSAGISAQYAYAWKYEGFDLEYKLIKEQLSK